MIANQTMERVKEIYWINHQVFKKLAVGGCFVTGGSKLTGISQQIAADFWDSSDLHQDVVGSHQRVFDSRYSKNFMRL